MKAIVGIFCAILALPVSAFGQRSKLSQLTPVAFLFPPKVECDVSPRVYRDLEEKFSSKSEPRDFISQGLKAIESNFDSENVLVHGIPWKLDGDRTIRLRKALTYKYDPRTFPKDPLVSLKRVFIAPLQDLATKALSF